MFPLFLVVFIDLVGFGIIIPLLPFLGEAYGASPAMVTTLFASYSIAQLLSAPFLGRLSDRYGRRPILLFSLVGSVLSYLMLGLVDSLALLFVARIFNGLMAGNIATALAYISDITTAETRAKGMGVIGAAFGLGFILGPAIGGIFAGQDPATADFMTPAFIAAALSALAFLLAIVKLPESLALEHRATFRLSAVSEHWTSFVDVCTRPRLGFLILLFFIATFVFASLETTFALWSHRQFNWGPQQNGYMFAYMGLISAFIQGGLIGRLNKRLGEKTLVISGFIFLGCGLATLAFSETFTLLITATTLIVIGFALSTPTLNTLISFEAQNYNQGLVMGSSRSATTLARALGPVCAGMIFAAYSKDAPYIVGALIMLIATILAFKIKQKPQGE